MYNRLEKDRGPDWLLQCHCLTPMQLVALVKTNNDTEVLILLLLNEGSERLPRAQTLVVTRTFSLPSLKRSITAALCSTCISPLSSATWWLSLDSSPASQPAVFLVWVKQKSHHCCHHHHHHRKRGNAWSASGVCSEPTEFDAGAELTWQKIMA